MNPLDLVALSAVPAGSPLVPRDWDAALWRARRGKWGLL